MPIEIAVSVLPAADLTDADAIEIRDIATQEELDEAVADGRKVYRRDDGPPVEIFDGGEWLTDERPVPTPAPTLNVPTTPYVDQRIELLQAEIEALADALLAVDPANAEALAVRGRAVDARAAIAFDSEAGMDALIRSYRGEPATDRSEV